LAKQEDCSLLTGDKSLRKAAEQEKVSVHGTIWLVEKLVRDGKISIAAAKAAYEQMKDAGSRIPWKRAKDGLRAIEQGGWS
jgi:predicted nucleic acid-binding protein